MASKAAQDMTTAKKLQLVGLAALAVVVVALAVVALRPTKVKPDEHAAPTADQSTDATCAPKTVVLLGDSTRDPSGPGKPLVEALTTDLPGTNVVALGKNGARLFVDHTVPPKAVEAKPDVVELSIGINDLRTDQRPARAAEFTDDLTAYVEDVHKAMPDAKVFITVPAALSTLDVDGSGYVADRDTTVNPPGAADEVTKSLRKAYLNVAAALDYVTLTDVQEQITGTDADDTDPPQYLSDQIHPSPATAGRIAGLLAPAFEAC